MTRSKKKLKIEHQTYQKIIDTFSTEFPEETEVIEKLRLQLLEVTTAAVNGDKSAGDLLKAIAQHIDNIERYYYPIEDRPAMLQELMFTIRDYAHYSFSEFKDALEELTPSHEEVNPYAREIVNKALQSLSRSTEVNGRKVEAILTADDPLEPKDVEAVESIITKMINQGVDPDEPLLEKASELLLNLFHSLRQFSRPSERTRAFVKDLCGKLINGVCTGAVTQENLESKAAEITRDAFDYVDHQKTVDNSKKSARETPAETQSPFSRILSHFNIPDFSSIRSAITSLIFSLASVIQRLFSRPEPTPSRERTDTPSMKH